jgi:hypothetical protein
MWETTCTIISTIALELKVHTFNGAQHKRGSAKESQVGRSSVVRSDVMR